MSGLSMLTSMPTRRMRSGFWARAATGHAAAPRPIRKSRRLMVTPRLDRGDRSNSYLCSGRPGTLRRPAQKRHPPLVMADVARRALGLEAGLTQALEYRRLCIMGQSRRLPQAQIIRLEDPHQPERRRPEEAVGGAE